MEAHEKQRAHCLWLSRFRTTFNLCKPVRFLPSLIHHHTAAILVFWTHYPGPGMACEMRNGLIIKVLCYLGPFAALLLHLHISVSFD